MKVTGTLDRRSETSNENHRRMFLKERLFYRITLDDDDDYEDDEDEELEKEDDEKKNRKRYFLKG